jgi:hypothetical protein
MCVLAPPAECFSPTDHANRFVNYCCGKTVTKQSPNHRRTLKSDD